MNGFERARRVGLYDFSRSNQLFERARHVIPGGVWGHHKFPAVLHAGKYPWFARRGAGAYFFDVDDNRYIDLICGYGAMVNGYAHPEIDAAAKEAMDYGDCFAQTTAISLGLAEDLVAEVQGMGWCAFGKNGSDALNVALLCARAATGRARMICIETAYHGSHFWCNWSNPGAGRPIDDSLEVTRVKWNSPEQIEEAFAEAPGSYAAVVLTPFHHPIPGPSEMPAEGYWRRVEALCHEHGALLIVDDVRTGFRLDLRGSHVRFGFQPDLVCLSKALGNTHPIAATLGRSELLEVASSIFAAGTFWGCSAPMAAARVNLRVLRERDAVTHMNRLGERLAAGFVQAGAAFGYEVTFSGAPAMPTMTIAGDAEFKWMQHFAEAIVARGVFIHPMHNWFVCAAHSEADIDDAVDRAAEAFEALAATVGRP